MHTGYQDSNLTWLYLFLFLVCHIIMGYVTKWMNIEKGYETGFQWGFWLGILGLVTVAVRPYSIEMQQSVLHRVLTTVEKEKNHANQSEVVDTIPIFKSEPTDT